MTVPKFRDFLKSRSSVLSRLSKIADSGDPTLASFGKARRDAIASAGTTSPDAKEAEETLDTLVDVVDKADGSVVVAFGEALAKSDKFDTYSAKVTKALALELGALARSSASGRTITVRGSDETSVKRALVKNGLTRDIVPEEWSLA